MTSIVFFGTPEFAVPALGRLIKEGWSVAAVVTNPDRPVGKSQTPSPTPVKEAALARGIPVMQPETLRDPDFIRRLSDLKPDLFVVAAYGKIIPEEILAIPSQGAVNVHPSLLPKYRGASPIEGAILAGEKETGVSIMLMDKDMDHGPILAEAKTAIGDNETGPALAGRLAELGAESLASVIPVWLQGNLEPIPQNHALATYTKILKKEDGKLLWNKTAAELGRQIRAYARWPESYGFWQKGNRALRLKIEAARAVSGADKKAPGAVWSAKDMPLAIATADGALAVDRLCLEGKKSVTAEEFVRGHPDIVGTVLT